MRKYNIGITFTNYHPKGLLTHKMLRAPKSRIVARQNKVLMIYLKLNVNFQTY